MVDLLSRGIIVGGLIIKIIIIGGLIIKGGHNWWTDYQRGSQFVDSFGRLIIKGDQIYRSLVD